MNASKLVSLGCFLLIMALAIFTAALGAISWRNTPPNAAFGVLAGPRVVIAIAIYFALWATRCWYDYRAKKIDGDPPKWLRAATFPFGL